MAEAELTELTEVYDAVKGHLIFDEDPTIPSPSSNTKQARNTKRDVNCVSPHQKPTGCACTAKQLCPTANFVTWFVPLFCVAQSIYLFFCFYSCAQIKPQEGTTTHCDASQEWTFWLLEACLWLFARAHERSEEVWPPAKEIIQ